MDWFLYGKDLRYEKVKNFGQGPNYVSADKLCSDKKCVIENIF